MASSLRVLILDYNPTGAQKRYTSLGKAGCLVVGIAPDERRVAELAGQCEPDVLLVNLGDNGSGILPRLRALKTELSLPLVLLGGDWENNPSEELKSAEADALVTNADDARALAAALEIAKRNLNGHEGMAGQTESLRNALHIRKVVGRAVGLLMDHDGLDRNQALEVLEAQAGKEGMALEEVSARLLARYEEK